MIVDYQIGKPIAEMVFTRIEPVQRDAKIRACIQFKAMNLEFNPMEYALETLALKSTRANAVKATPLTKRNRG